MDQEDIFIFVSALVSEKIRLNKFHLLIFLSWLHMGWIVHAGAELYLAHALPLMPLAESP